MLATADRVRFGTVIQALAATFRVDVTEALLEGYRIGLDDLEQELFEQAARRALRECRFMPTPAELRSFARSVLTLHLPSIEEYRAQERLRRAEKQRMLASWVGQKRLTSQPSSETEPETAEAILGALMGPSMDARSRS